MSHRLKLRLLYGPLLDADAAARRRKMRVILLSGVAVYPPFLFIAFRLYSNVRPLPILAIGLLAALTCVPVGLYAYAEGFGCSVREIWRTRAAELRWFCVKIGFLYAFLLYWMILGMVEFFFGYHAFRAALISFVASAVARDGFEIGYLAARPALTPDIAPGPKRIFPDGRRRADVLRGQARQTASLLAVALLCGGAIGGFVGWFLPNPMAQTLWVGVAAGGMATLVYCRDAPGQPHRGWRYFLWPGLTMGCSYFFILAYWLRVMLGAPLSLSWDLALLTAACCGLSVLDARVMGRMKTALAHVSGLDLSPSQSRLKKDQVFFSEGVAFGKKRRAL